MPRGLSAALARTTVVRAHSHRERRKDSHKIIPSGKKQADARLLVRRVAGGGPRPASFLVSFFHFHCIYSSAGISTSESPFKAVAYLASLARAAFFVLFFGPVGWWADKTRETRVGCFGGSSRDREKRGTNVRAGPGRRRRSRASAPASR